jgi:ribosome-binding factor A
VTPAQIKQKRTESLLQELIPEAISSLSDGRLHEVDVIEVVCSRGRSDAKVYLDPHSYTEKERNLFLKLLSKARPLIETHCMQDQGWYRCPNLTFEFDEHFQRVTKVEELFKKIAKPKEDKDES